MIPKLFRCHANLLLEDAEEVFRIIVADRFCDLIHLSGGILQGFPGFLNTYLIEIVDEFHPCPLFKKCTEITSIQEKQGRDEILCQLLLIIVLNIKLHLFDHIIPRINVLCLQKLRDIEKELLIVRLQVFQPENLNHSILHTAHAAFFPS